jgi:hypothetical protein
MVDGIASVGRFSAFLLKISCRPQRHGDFLRLLQQGESAGTNPESQPFLVIIYVGDFGIRNSS